MMEEESAFALLGLVQGLLGGKKALGWQRAPHPCPSSPSAPGQGQGAGKGGERKLEGGRDNSVDRSGASDGGKNRSTEQRRG